ncbi:pescadillo protein, partial [Helicosporidium sp. ATCC 50920]
MFMKKKASVLGVVLSTQRSWLSCARGTSGEAVQYMTRTDALRKLQLTLGAFRRLCILKGIHPREPRKKRLARQKTYYHVKDISFLAHEPLLQIMRELRIHQRRLRRAAVKGGAQAALRVAKQRPEYRLDSLVRERYPSFLDALRDLDDPLTLVHLFASLPSNGQDSDSWRRGVGTAGERPRNAHELSLKAASLALEWQAWVVRSGSLRAAFISVKGFYFRAVVQGTEVTWLVPHALSQLVPEDVDMGVMHTFLELYVCLLGFVHHRLYREQGLRYPP